MKAYKGFNKDMTCRGFQYEEGKEYETEKAELCKNGFHACEYPLDVFNYYFPAQSRYCEVELDDVSDERQGDSKVCSKKIKIGAELDLKGIVKASFEFIRERCTPDKIGGDQSALTGGDQSALTGGDQSALTGGYRSVVYGGEGAKVRAGMQSVLAIQFWKNYEFVCIKFAEVDGEKIKENTYYRLDENGEFVEAE